MHDLHEANKILKLILDFASQNKLTRVSKAVIELGSLVEHGAEIAPENLQFNLKLLAKSTIAAGLEVEVKKIKGDFWRLKEIKGE